MLFGWWLGALVCNRGGFDDTGFDSELTCFGDIRADESELDFGQVQVGDAPNTTVWITNESNCSVPIESVTLDVDDGSFAVRPVTASLIPAFDAISIVISFTPQEPGARADFLTLALGGEFPTELDVELYGVGIAGEAELDASALDFSSVALGCEAELTLTLTNAGDAPLVLEELALDGEEFTVETQWGDPLPLEIRAGGRQQLLVRYTPVDEGPDLATLTLVTDDTLQPALVVDLSGAGYAAATSEERFSRTENGQSDILFAVSTAESMAPYADRLADAFESLVDELTRTGADYHVAVVTGDDGCVAGPVATIDADMSPRYAGALLSSMLYAHDEPQANALNTLELMRLALDPTASEGCNAPFYRPDATLALIGVINGPDQSPLDWSEYVAGFQALKDDPSRVSMHAIGGPYPAGCDAVLPSERLIDAVLSLDGEIHSICDTDYSAALERIATLSAVDVRRYALSGEPIPATLFVFVDGIPSTDWTYDALANAIVFDDGAVPAFGSEVVVDYASAATCE